MRLINDALLFIKNKARKDVDSAVITEIVAQWGISGLVLLGAGYIIWDNYKTNKNRSSLDFTTIFDKLSEFTDTKINAMSACWEAKLSDLQAKILEFQTNSDNKFNELKEQLTAFQDSQTKFNEDITKRIESLENKLYKSPEDIYEMESKRMQAIVQSGPAIHSILKTSMNNCNADHIFLAIFHNGATGITGIPYVKFDVIAEKFLPIENPKDHELIRYYKGEDILHHNKLGSVLTQHSVTEFNLADDTLKEIDPIEYKRCIEIGAKYVAYVSIIDSHSRIAGFLGAYSFEDKLDIREFEECAENISEVYNNLVTNSQIL